MASTFGRLFRVTTWGESHGPALGVVVDGCPAGLELNEEIIQRDLDRRRVGQSEVTSPRQERDRVTILSGIFEGKTTGAPISLITYNADADSSKYEPLRAVFRPGHADYTYWVKYGHRDHRGGGRSSARETWGRVAAGAIARQLLRTVAGVEVYGFVRELAGITIETFDREEIDRNPVRCPDPVAAQKMVAAILEAKEQKTSVGGIVEVRAVNVPPGLGEPTMDKLDALIGYAMLSIPAVKGVEIGDGFAAARLYGHEHNDPFVMEDGQVRTLTNHAGGMLGGISTGEEIVVRLAVKPTSSIARPQQTVDIYGNEQTIVVEGRHDPSICPRVVPVAEAMLLLVLADCYLMNRAARV